MARVALLVALLAAVYFGGRWYKQLPSERKKRARHGAWLGLAGLALLGLVATGRVHWLAFLLAPLAWVAKGAFRLLPQLPMLHRLWQQLRGARTAETGAGGSVASSDRMTPERACSILEVSVDAGREEILDAHRRLIRKVHPDTGGSTYLASQINQARDVLLGR